MNLTPSRLVNILTVAGAFVYLAGFGIALLAFKAREHAKSVYNSKRK